MTPSAPLSQLRVLGRISVAFILDVVRVGRMDREFLDSLIVLAIVQANVTPVTGDRGLHRTYADYEQAPPDDLRRPVSVSSVAQSLRQPYETVRRRIAKLAQEDGFELTSQGIYVSRDALSGPEHRAMVMTNYQLLRDFYLRLRGLGALADVAAIAAVVEPAPDAAPPVRAVARVSSDYVLRVVDMLTQHLGDLVRGLVFFAVLVSNTEHLPDSERGSDEGGPASFVPDELRRPVRVAALAARLELPEETVRRHAARLVEDRLCVRSAAGLIVPAHVLARPTFVRLMGDNNAHVRRMFAGLARIGVVAEWERHGRAAATA